MAKYVRTLGDIGSNLLTELSRQGKRLFTLEDAAKIIDIFGYETTKVIEVKV